MKDEIIGVIIHNGKKIKIAYDNIYPKIYGFITDPDDMVYEIDFARSGYSLKIHLLKVYGNIENQGLGTKALKNFENWAFTKGYEKIKGELVASKDCSEREKLEHFYNVKNSYNLKRTKDSHIYAKISKSLV